MAYVGASTDNPYGFRPWVSRLGDLGQAPEIYVPSATTPGGAAARTVLGQELPEYAVRTAVTGAGRRLSQYGTVYNPDYYLRRGMYSGRTLGQMNRDLAIATGRLSQYPTSWSPGAAFPMSGYERANFVLPTATPVFQPMGAFRFADSLPLIAAAALVLLFTVGSRKRSIFVGARA